MTRVCLPRKPHDKLGIMPCPTTPTTCRTTSATKRRRTFWKIEKTTKNTTEIKWLPDNDGGGSEAFYVGVFRASYFNQRYYDPELGRFLSNDPKHQSMNPYMYCSNSPLMYVDPDGEFWWLVAAAVAASFDWNKGQFKDFSKLQTWVDIAGSVLAVAGIQAAGSAFGSYAEKYGMNVSIAFEMPDLGVMQLLFCKIRIHSVHAA